MDLTIQWIFVLLNGVAAIAPRTKNVTERVCASITNVYVTAIGSVPIVRWGSTKTF